MAEISGQIIAVLPTKSGTSAKGTAWSSQTAVITTIEQYPKKVAFDVMNEKIAQFNLQVGEYVTVSYDIDAHEYQGRWFNAVRAECCSCKSATAGYTTTTCKQRMATTCKRTATSTVSTSTAGCIAR